MAAKDMSTKFDLEQVQEADLVVEGGRITKNRFGKKKVPSDGCYTRIPPFLAPFGGKSKPKKPMQFARSHAEIWRTAMSTISATASLITVCVVVFHG